MDRPFTPVPSEFLDALIRSRLSGGQWRIVCWTLRNTLGWHRASTRFTWYRIAREIKMDRTGVLRAAKCLLDSGLLVMEDGRLSVQTQSAPPPKTVTTRIGDARHRKRCQP